MLLDKLAGISHEPHRNLTQTLQVLKPTIYTMATPPLETIPEEETPTTTTTPAPARVTADQTKTKPATAKNPGRVASGKRLAKRNRLAREAKKKAEAEGASAQAQPSGNPPSQPGDNNTPAGDNSISLMTMLGIGGLLVSAAGVYYQREAIRKRFTSPPPEPAQQAPSRIAVKRGIRQMD